MSWIIKKCKKNSSNKIEYFCYNARQSSYFITESKSFAEYLKEKDSSELLSFFHNKNIDSSNEKKDFKYTEGFRNKFETFKEYNKRYSEFLEKFRKDYTIESAHSCIWALTPVCNLKCTYCYNTELVINEKKAPSKEELFHIARALVDGGIGEVNLGGGEPLTLGNDLWEIMDFLLENHISVVLLTNTILMKEEHFLKIKELSNKGKGRLSVTISVDGHNPEIHSLTRGGGFEKIVENMKKLRSYNIPFYVETVVTNKNIKYIREISKFSYEIGALGVIFQRLGACVSVDTFYSLVPKLKDEVEAVKIIKELQKEYWGMSISDFELDFPCWDTDGKVMDCLIAGRFSCYVDPYGTIFPCTAAISDEVALGNLHNSSLRQIWSGAFENPYVRMLNRKTQSLEGCSDCELAQNCNGGCRGEALFLYKDIEAKPYRCKKKLIKEGDGN